MGVDEEEDEPPIDKDADELYEPNDEDEDDDNSFDHDDNMSEDGVVGEGDEVEQESLHISSDEDKGTKKKRKQAKECIENAKCWKVKKSSWKLEVGVGAHPFELVLFG